MADNATTEVHSTRRWKLGVEQMSGDEEDWSPVDITNDPSLKLDEGTKNGSGVSIIEAGGARLRATRTSDLGYEDDGLGVNSVAGDMVLFDIDPTKWSWSDGSPDLRPGLNNNDVVPKCPGGHAEYDSGETNIPQSGVWMEDPSKGNSAGSTMLLESGSLNGLVVKNQCTTGEQEKIENAHSGCLEMVMECWFGIKTMMELSQMQQNL